MLTDQQDISKATQHLQELLVENRLAGFSTGDVWVMRFVENEFQLACHELLFSEEDHINQSLRDTIPALFDCADPNDIAKAAALSAVTRRKIISVSIDENAVLSLVFEGDIRVILATDTDVVDWQWCVSKNDPNPYHEEYEIACLWRGEISQPRLTKGT